MTTTLFDRLGGAEGITSISNAIVEAHKANPIIGVRFLDSDNENLKVLVRDFFMMGSGGPNQYKGRDMAGAHRGMNLTERELCSAIDDVLNVLDAHDIDGASRNEVLAILYSFKDEVCYQ